MTNAGTLNMGAGTWTLRGAASLMNIATGVTLNKETANITVIDVNPANSKTIAAVGKTLNNITQTTNAGGNGVGTLTLGGSGGLTIADLHVAQQGEVVINQSGTLTVSSITFDNGQGYLHSSNASKAKISCATQLVFATGVVFRSIDIDGAGAPAQATDCFDWGNNLDINFLSTKQKASATWAA